MKPTLKWALALGVVMLAIRALRTDSPESETETLETALHETRQVTPSPQALEQSETTITKFAQKKNPEFERWFDVEASELAERPLRESFAMVNALVNQHPSPTPQVLRLLKLETPAQPAQVGHLEQTPASRFMLVRDHLLTELAASAGADPEKWNPSAELQERLVEIAKKEANLALVRGAAEALLALNAGTYPKASEIVEARAPNERFAFAGLADFDQPEDESL